MNKNSSGRTTLFAIQDWMEMDFLWTMQDGTIREYRVKGFDRKQDVITDGMAW